MERILVLGGSGHFGGRICRRLAGERNTELIVTSRSEGSAEAVARELRRGRPGAAVAAARLDQSSAGFEHDLWSLRPDIVVHTAGPYQGQDYRVAKACIAAGSHYLDLADGRDFVHGFRALDRPARERGLLLVSGASTLPGLSSVVVDLLRERFAAIDTIEISIAPAHRTPRGEGTIAAVLSYCGRPFPVLADGRRATRYGWQDLRILRHPSLGLRLAAACDVPDLALLPETVPGVRTVTFHAALEAKWEQLALWAMGWLTRTGIVPDWTPFVPRFRWLSDRLIGLGSDTGGMQVRLTGSAVDGSPKSVAWYLTARRNHGPEIPCSPALLLARKLAAGRLSVRGAHACLGMFTMAEFDAEVRDFDIAWSVEEAA